MEYEDAVGVPLHGYLLTTWYMRKQTGIANYLQCFTFDPTFAIYPPPNASWNEHHMTKGYLIHGDSTTSQVCLLACQNT